MGQPAIIFRRDANRALLTLEARRPEGGSKQGHDIPATRCNL